MTSVRAFASACFWVLVKTPSTNFTFTKGMFFPFGKLARSGTLEERDCTCHVDYACRLSDVEGRKASGSKRGCGGQLAPRRHVGLYFRDLFINSGKGIGAQRQPQWRRLGFRRRDDHL